MSSVINPLNSLSYLANSPIATQTPAATSPSGANSTSGASNSGTANSSASTNAAVSATDSLGNENTFLQLLVAQIQNQDPTSPVDSNQFLSQLAEFSQLEQLIGIRQDVSQLDPTTAATTSTTGTSGTSTTQTNGTQ
jgi:flagellar basal-body rod modification protein FlgD